MSKKYIVDLVRASADIHSERGIFIKNLLEPSSYPVNLRYAPPEYLFNNEWVPQSDIYVLGMHLLNIPMEYDEITQQASKSKRKVPDVPIPNIRAHCVFMELLQLALGNNDVPRKFSKRYKSNPIVIPGEMRSFLQQILHWDYRKRGEYGFASVYYHPYLEQDITDDTYRPKPPMIPMKSMIPLAELISYVFNPAESPKDIEPLKILGVKSVSDIPRDDTYDIANLMSTKVSASMQEIAVRVNMARVANGLDLLNMRYTTTYDIYFQVLRVMLTKLKMEVDLVYLCLDCQQLRDFYLSEVAVAWHTPVSISHVLEEIETDERYRLSDSSYHWDRIYDELLLDNRVDVENWPLEAQTEYLHDMAQFIQDPAGPFQCLRPDSLRESGEEEVSTPPSETHLESTKPPESK